MPLFTYEINCFRDRTFEIQAKKKKTHVLRCLEPLQLFDLLKLINFLRLITVFASEKSFMPYPVNLLLPRVLDYTGRISWKRDLN